MMPEPISKPTEVFLPPNSPKRAISAYGLKRSEEHTSELQSPCNLVCRLLLEKKQIRRIHQRVVPRGARADEDDADEDRTVGHDSRRRDCPRLRVRRIARLCQPTLQPPCVQPPT